MRLDLKKVEAVRRFSQPKSQKNIKQFLGLAGYYRRFIPDFSTIAKPSTFLLKKNVPFRWTESQSEAFNQLKNILSSQPLLQYPDFTRPFIVSTDASNYGLGGVLSQDFDGKILPIAYTSRTLNESETNYSTTQKEMLAILFSVETFRPYLYGRKFTLETDHQPLTWLYSFNKPNSKIVRWRLRLNEYDFRVVYKKGISNLNADALSRNPYDGEQSRHDIEDKTSLEDFDPLDSSSKLTTHEVLTCMNRTPVRLYPFSSNQKFITRVENAFLGLNSLLVDKNIENKYYPCRNIHKKTNKYEPDSDDAFETADEGSDGEQNEPVIRNINFDRQKTFECGARSETSACSAHTEDEAEFDNHTSEPQDFGAISTIRKSQCSNPHQTKEKCLMSKSPGCGAISGESRLAVLTPVFDKDDRHSNCFDNHTSEPQDFGAISTIRKSQCSNPHQTKNKCIMSKSPGCGATSGESRVAVLTPVFDKDDRPSNSVEKRQVTEVRVFYREGTNLKIQEKTSNLENQFDDNYDTDFSESEHEILNNTYLCQPVLVNDEPTPSTSGLSPASKFHSTNELINPEFSCIKTSKDKLHMRDDNLVLFIPADLKITTQTGRELIQSNRLIYEDLLNENPENLQIKNVIVIKHENYCIFYLIIKQTFDSKPYLQDIIASIHGLKVAMDSLKIKTVSISRIGNGFNQISWPTVESELRAVFGGGDYTITVCYGEIEIPSESDWIKIIRENHCSVSGGHKGATKTYERIRENFYWPNMRDQIRKFVRECETCKLYKAVRIKTKLPMRITDTPSESFEKIEIDIVGPLPETENGNKYILTIQDNLTKYSDGIPLRNTESKTIALAFAENFITRFGCPKIIHTDQGSNFISQLMLTFCKIFKIKHIRSTAFHPQSLGSLERSHYELIQYLKIYCKKSNWDKWLRFALFSYNTSRHDGTGFTPHELIFAKKARMPSEFMKHELPLTYDLFLNTLTQKVTKTQAEARERLCAAKERAKRYYDAKLNCQTYCVGDPVYLQKSNKITKLDAEYSGPFKIVNIFDNNNVELELGQGKTKIVHMNKLRPQTIKIFPNAQEKEQ